MSAPSPVFMRLLAAAADSRAAGKSWEVVAAKLNRAVDTCRRWPTRYRAVWDDLYRAAECTQMAEARAEATSVLRTQLRLDETKETREAAKALLAAANRNRPGKTESHVPSIEEFSESLSNAQVQDVADECQPSAGVDGPSIGAAGD